MKKFLQMLVAIGLIVGVIHPSQASLYTILNGNFVGTQTEGSSVKDSTGGLYHEGKLTWEFATTGTTSGNIKSHVEPFWSSKNVSISGTPYTVEDSEIVGFEPANTGAATSVVYYKTNALTGIHLYTAKNTTDTLTSAPLTVDSSLDSAMGASWYTLTFDFLREYQVSNKTPDLVTVSDLIGRNVDSSSQLVITLLENINGDWTNPTSTEIYNRLTGPINSNAIRTVTTNEFLLDPTKGDDYYKIQLQFNGGSSSMSYYSLTNVKLNAVPEPSAYTMLVGVGLVGLGLLRKKRCPSKIRSIR